MNKSFVALFLFAGILSAPFSASAAPHYPSAMDACTPNAPWVIGWSSPANSPLKPHLSYLSCGPDKHLHEEMSPRIDQKTGKPLGPIPVGAVSHSSAPQPKTVVFDRNNSDTYPAKILAAPKDGKTYTDMCQLDPNVPQEWAAVQTWALTNMGCARSYRYVAGPTNTGTPKTLLTSSADLLSVNSCKLQNNSNQVNTIYQGFPRPAEALNLTKSAVFQIVPVQFSDYKSSNTPAKDYDQYLKFLTDFITNSSDVPVHPVVRMPDHYFQMSQNIASYHLDEHSDPSAFQKEMVNLTKSSINYEGVNEIIVVVPPQVPASVLFASGLGWPATQTPAGAISATYVMGAHPFGPRANGGEGSSTDPCITVHEAIGHEAFLNDHGGAGTTYGQSEPANPNDMGAGYWGNMSGVNGDFMAWDKWLMGFISDSQIDCLNPNTVSTVWIHPSTTKNDATKGAIIPLDKQHGIFLESERSTGYNFKLPKSSNGLLVYTLDTSDTRPDYGVYVQRPSNRIGSIGQNDFVLSNATLVQGESITVKGYKITVVEAGDFGDVVKVAKA